ncbi:hypothetical protein ABZ820_24125 [Streptomyces diacarni]|uniref:hypothetical protein n=1 Tax=Streptomyces diacarni TaxID=2800381 RepID=UPI0033EB546F
MFKTGSVGVVAAGLVLVLSGCGGADEKAGGAKGESTASAKPASARPPSKKLVKWVGAMCESTTALKNIRKDSTKDVAEIRNAGEGMETADFLAFSYISGASSKVREVEGDLAELAPSGPPAADRLQSAWLKKLGDVGTKLDEVFPTAALDDPKSGAEDVDKLIQSLTSPEPGLTALTKKDREIAAAHERAEQCAPGWKPDEATQSPAPASSGPLPKAADGKKTGACADGTCEVLVTGTKDIAANGLNLHVIVAKDSVTFRTGGSVMQLGGSGGVAEFGDDLTITVVAQNEDGAVLKFRP